MKRPGLTWPLVSATLFLTPCFVPPANAQEMMANSPAAKSAKRAEELLKRFDKNGDGKLDDDERAEAKETALTEQVDRQMSRATGFPGGLEQFRAEALEMFDKNRDGRLDDDERGAAQKFGAEAEEFKKRFDRNGDGAWNPEERARAESFLSALRSLGNGQGRSELLRRFDVNGDGRIDEQEFPELEKFVRPRVEASVDQLRRHDTNGDGTLDDTEWARARGLIAEWLNAPNTPTPGAAKATSSVETERARLDAVAREVARRRALRDASSKSGGTPK